MNIYTFKDLFVNNDNVYKDMSDPHPSFSDESIAAYKNGDALERVWACDADNKVIGTKIMAPYLSMASTKYAPSGIINPIVIDGNADVYAFLQPKHFEAEAPLLDQFFMMFEKYKAVVVTEAFKEH